MNKTLKLQLPSKLFGMPAACMITGTCIGTQLDFND